MEIDFIQRFGFGRVPDSTFQDILVDTCAITEAGVCMPGGVGCISGELPGKLRFTLAVLVIRIRLNANFLQERIELAVAPVLFVPKTSFAISWVFVKQFSRNDTATACQDWLRSTRLGRGSIKSHVRTVKVLGMGLFAFQERIHLWKGVTH